MIRTGTLIVYTLENTLPLFFSEPICCMVSRAHNAMMVSLEIYRRGLSIDASFSVWTFPVVNKNHFYLKKGPIFCPISCPKINKFVRLFLRGCVFFFYLGVISANTMVPGTTVGATFSAHLVSWPRIVDSEEVLTFLLGPLRPFRRGRSPCSRPPRACPDSSCGRTMVSVAYRS